MTLETAIAITVAGSALCSLSWVLQKQAAVILPRISARFESSTLMSFLTSARWLLGVSMMAAGFLSFQYAVASNGEIAILQPMFGAGSAMLAVCAVVFLHERFSPLEWLALVVLLVGLAVLGFAAEAHAP